MVVYLPYVPTYTAEPTVCSGGARPGTVALQTWVCTESPWAATFYDLGIYACRDVYGGWCPDCNRSALSTHASGGAGDSGCRVVADGHPHGHALAAWLVEHADMLGVQEVIWCRRRWDNQTRRWRAYGGISPHLDHVHWAQNAQGRRYCTLGRIRSLAPSAPPPPIPEPEPTPGVYQEDPVMLYQAPGGSFAYQAGPALIQVTDASETDPTKRKAQAEEWFSIVAQRAAQSGGAKPVITPCGAGLWNRLKAAYEWVPIK